MREKLFKICNNVYSVLMTISFFGGVLPLVPFLIALCIGGGAGGTGEAIATFLHNDYYPWVIMAGSVAIVFGLIAMYIGKLEGLSIKKVSVDSDEEQNDH
ncbi:MAG: hypothetical protein E7527_01475 [Ruminococcaceae bacterium]|nr:hypothetical protein [Oscillospiraceae bacterium]